MDSGHSRILITMKGDVCGITEGAAVTTRPLVKGAEALRILQEHLQGAAEAMVEVTSEEVRKRLIQLLQNSPAAQATASDSGVNAREAEGGIVAEHTETFAEVNVAALIAQVQERIRITTDAMAYPGELLMIAPGVSSIGQAHPAWTIKSIAAAWDAGGDEKTSPAAGRWSAEAGKPLPHPAKY